MYKIGDIITTTEGDNVVAEITNLNLDYWGDGTNIVAYSITYLHGEFPWCLYVGHKEYTGDNPYILK